MKNCTDDDRCITILPGVELLTLHLFMFISLSEALYRSCPGKIIIEWHPSYGTEHIRSKKQPMRDHTVGSSESVLLGVN